MNCPICNKDSNNKEIRLKAIQLCKDNEIEWEDCNPGGRKLHFKNKGSLQISDMCVCCDYEKIKEFLK